MSSPAVEPSAKKVKRTYVACIPCRKRKVKCEITKNPPCAKCQREHRECTFRNTQTAVKHREAPYWVQRETQSPSRDSARSSSIPASTNENNQQDNDQTIVDVPIAQDEPHDHQETSSSTWQDDSVMSTVMTQPRHALEALFTAARTVQNNVQSEHQNATTPGTAFDFESRPGFSAPSPLSLPVDSVLDAWDKFRFVRQGWFTAQEAVTYVDLFYQNLAPLCPLILDKWKDHNSHEDLITQEALLCAVILATSSRFHVLAGPGGYSRGHHIHSKLWQHCERLIQRLMLGQEKTSSAKIRTVGTIEALILISDWQPRAVHFPPETDGWDVSFLPRRWDKKDRVAQLGGTSFIRWQEDVFEPAKRADRMSWMLLGAATNLLFEIGSSPDDHTDAIRFARTKTVLGIYVSQTASRLGIPSILSQQLGDNLPLNTGPLMTVREQQWTALMEKWTELITLEKTASTVFFRSSTHVKQTISDGRYMDVIRHFMPSLQAWENAIFASNDLPQALRYMLQVQFYHLRILIRAITLQAVVNRLSSFENQYESSNADIISLQDQNSIRELVDDCHSVLRTAADLASIGALRYAPSRTLINITSASVFLLKAVSVGSRVSELKQSLDILDGAIRVLKSAPVDDMDFAARYASLIEEHVKRFRSNFKVFRTTRHNSPARGSAGSLEPSNPTDANLVPRRQNAAEIIANFDFSGEESGLFEDEWWSQPFDPAVAPFNMSHDHITWGLDLESLDFLWNISS